MTKEEALARLDELTKVPVGVSSMEYPKPGDANYDPYVEWIMSDDCESEDLG